MAASVGRACIEMLEHAGIQPQLRLIAAVADALETIGEGELANQMLAKGAEALDQNFGGFDDEDLSYFLSGLGGRQWNAGRLEEAQATFERLSEIELRRGDDLARAYARGGVADVLFAREEFDEALRIRREEQLPVFARFKDVRSTAITQGRIADILQIQGKFDEVLRIRRDEELPVYIKLDDKKSITVTQGEIAHVLIRQKDYDGARELLLSRLEINRTLLDADGIAASLWDLAQLDILVGDNAGAFPRLVEAWPMVVKMDKAKAIAVVGHLFGAMLAKDDPAHARQVWTLSADAYRKLGRFGKAETVERLIADLNG